MSFIKPFSTFPNELDVEFRQHYAKEQSPVAWFAILIGCCLFMAFYFWDLVVDIASSNKTLVVRVSVTSILITFLLLPAAFFERHLQKILAVAMCEAGIGVAVIIFIVHDGLAIGLSGLMLVLMFNFGFSRLLFVPSCITGIVICLAYNIAALYAGLPDKLIIANNFFLVSGLVAGGTVTYLVERLFRTNFLRNKDLELQKARTDALIYNLLPHRIADRLRSGETVIAENLGEATVFFSDLVGFTSLTKKLAPGHLVQVLNDIFSILDALTEKNGVEKIKTTGDGYMVVSGVSGIGGTSPNGAEEIAEFALEVVNNIKRYLVLHKLPLDLRIGISTGQVIGGVIGLKKLSFDLWGETVNLASRMESHCETGHIQVCEATYWRLQDKYEFEERGLVDVKGIGPVQTFLLTGRKNGTQGASTGEDEALPRIGL